jgi:hypothetical protein
MTFDELLAFNSKVFHSGFYYVTVSLFFMCVTIYALKLLRDIRDSLKK